MRRVRALLLVVAVGVVSVLGAVAEGADSRAAGDIQWTRQFGLEGFDSGEAVAVHSTGVYVTGKVRGALPGQTHYGDDDVFVRRYDHAGKHRWTRQFGGTAERNDVGCGIAVNDLGVYVVGKRVMKNDLGHVRGDQLFLRKYNHAGKHQWTKQFGISPSEVLCGVAVDASGVYVTGNVEGAYPGHTHYGLQDVLVRKYGHNGAHHWTRQFGTYSWEHGSAVAVNDSGVYVTGAVNGALPGQTHRGGGDIFVRKYSPAGKALWTRQFGTGFSDEGRGVAVDASGVYVIGRVEDALPGQTHQGGRDVFVRKYDHAGKHQWTRQFGTGGWDVGQAVAVNSSGVYVAGHAGGALPGQTHQGLADVFVRHYSRDGGHRWTRQFGAWHHDDGLGVAANNVAVYVTGYVSGALPHQTHGGAIDVFLRKYSTK